MLHKKPSQKLLKRACLIAALGAAVLLPGWSASADEAKDHFDKGVELYKARKDSEALKEFDLALKIRPGDPTILNWIGFINLQDRNYKEAQEPLEKVVKLRPNSAEAHLNLGNVYDGLKQYPEAIREFETVARLQQSSSDPSKAADPYYNMGSVYYKMHRLPESVAAYQRAAALNPKDAYIQDGLNFVQQAWGNYDQAVKAGEKATSLMPDNADFWLNLALADLGVARKAQSASGATTKATADKYYGNARMALDRAARLAPNNFQVRETWGETLYDTGHDAEAVTQFQKATEIDPKQYTPCYNLGLALTRQGKYADAAAAFRHALENRADSREALHGLGLAQFKQGEYDEATKTFKKLTEQDPGDGPAWINLSACLHSKGDDDGEQAALEEAVKHGGNSPSFASVHRALAGLYYKKGDADSLKHAQDEYQITLRSMPRDAEALNGLGLIAQKEKRTDDAIRYFKQATEAKPNVSDYYNNLGVAYEANGQKDLAIANYKKALQINTTNELARKNLERFQTATNTSGK